MNIKVDDKLTEKHYSLSHTGRDERFMKKVTITRISKGRIFRRSIENEKEQKVETVNHTVI